MYKHKSSVKTALSWLMLALTMAFFAESVKCQCKPQVWCFNPGEELYYNVIYNWGFIWVDAGRVEFKVKRGYYNSSPVYHFSGYGTSLKKHDWFFRVRDYFDSYAGIDDLKPIHHIRNTSEGKYKADEKYWFDYSKNKIYSQVSNSNKATEQDTINLNPCVFDIMTAVYYARTIDLSLYKPKQKIPLTMIVDNEIYNLYGRYLGKEKIKTIDKKQLDCLKFSILLVEGTMFKGGEDLTVWVSDDENRVPILVEAKVLVGLVKAIFTNAKNLKIPMQYLPDLH